MLLQQDSRSSSVSVMTSHPGYEFAIKHGIVGHSHKSFGDEWISSAEIVVVPRAELDFAAILICYGTVTSINEAFTLGRTTLQFTARVLLTIVGLPF
jgi:hypothetical protein